MSNHLYDVLSGAAHGSVRTAIHLPDGDQVSYRELYDLAEQLAAYLARSGVGPDDRVAAQVEKSWQSLALYLACVRAGAVFLPLNPAYPLAELEYFVGDAEPTVVVCRPADEEGVRGLCGKLGQARVETLGTDGRGTLLAAAADAPGVPAVARGPKDMAAILYTSGTTGRSKGAILTHENLLSNARVLADCWRFTEADVLLHALPIFHTHGLFVACNVLLLAGGSMIFLPKFDADEVLRLMSNATTMMGVPTFYVRLLAHAGLTRDATRHLRLFTSGSAPLLASTHVAFHERTGHAILERYGMTETGMNTSNPYDGERVPGTVGVPLPGVEVRTSEPETGKVLERGEVGVLEVRGPNVFPGYWRAPEKSESEFRPGGFFITGDIARVEERGYVSIVGRAKDLVITGGYNVYPSEVESEIDAVPGVLESAVIGVAHPDFGEGVTAVVVLQRGTKLTESELSGALQDRLARFKRPKRIFFVDALPRNAMGKVQKNALRETYAGAYLSP